MPQPSCGTGVEPSSSSTTLHQLELPLDVIRPQTTPKHHQELKVHFEILRSHKPTGSSDNESESHQIPENIASSSNTTNCNISTTHRQRTKSSSTKQLLNERKKHYKEVNDRVAQWSEVDGLSTQMKGRLVLSAKTRPADSQRRNMALKHWWDDKDFWSRPNTAVPLISDVVTTPTSNGLRRKCSQQVISNPAFEVLRGGKLVSDEDNNESLPVTANETTFQTSSSNHHNSTAAPPRNVTLIRNNLSTSEASKVHWWYKDQHQEASTLLYVEGCGGARDGRGGVITFVGEPGCHGRPNRSRMNGVHLSKPGAILTVVKKSSGRHWANLVSPDRPISCEAPTRAVSCGDDNEGIWDHSADLSVQSVQAPLQEFYSKFDRPGTSAGGWISAVMRRRHGSSGGKSELRLTHRRYKSAGASLKSARQKCHQTNSLAPLHSCPAKDLAGTKASLRVFLPQSATQ